MTKRCKLYEKENRINKMNKENRENQERKRFSLNREFTEKEPNYTRVVPEKRRKRRGIDHRENMGSRGSSQRREDSPDHCSSARETLRRVYNIHPLLSQTISLLYELGARHIELVPFYPGLDEIPQLDTAITPREV